jgi:hypothetical protein
MLGPLEGPLQASSMQSGVSRRNADDLKKTGERKPNPKQLPSSDENYGRLAIGIIQWPLSWQRMTLRSLKDSAVTQVSG